MNCELLRFCRLLEGEIDLEKANAIVFNEEEKELLRGLISFYVACEFTIKNPDQLTDIEIAEYMIAKNKHRVSCYKDQFLIQREILKLPEHITIQDVIDNEPIVPDGKQIALERFGELMLTPVTHE